MPIYPGGQAEMFNYFTKNIFYKSIPDTASLQSRLILRFVVDTLGNVVDPQVIRSIHPSLDEEYVKVLLSMPKWEPGKQNNKKVAVQLTVPFRICFRK